MSRLTKPPAHLRPDVWLNIVEGIIQWLGRRVMNAHFQIVINE